MKGKLYSLKDKYSKPVPEPLKEEPAEQVEIKKTKKSK